MVMCYDALQQVRRSYSHHPVFPGDNYLQRCWRWLIIHLIDHAHEVTMIIVETEHLLFRPLTLSDLDDLAALYADPEVMRFLGGPRGKEEVLYILNRYI